MHELSIAMSILELASEEAQRRGGVRVTAIRLRLGPLSGVAGDALQSAYDLAREGSSLPAAKLIIEKVPLVAHCPTCSRQRTLSTPQELCCPVCHTPTPDIVSGRDLEVVALEIEA
jgi:hydrogenase nickel incorporation protein HypA/HybF